MFTDLRVPRFGKVVETSCSRLPQLVLLSSLLGGHSFEIVPSEFFRVRVRSGSSDLGLGFWVRYFGRLATHWLKLMWEDIERGQFWGLEDGGGRDCILASGLRQSQRAQTAISRRQAPRPPCPQRQKPRHRRAQHAARLQKPPKLYSRLGFGYISRNVYLQGSACSEYVQGFKRLIFTSFFGFF